MNMSQNKLYTLVGTLGVFGLIGLIGLFGLQKPKLTPFEYQFQPVTLGSGAPVSAFEKQLASALSTSDTTIVFTSVTDLRGNAIATSSLATTTAFIIEPENSTRAELVLCRRNDYDQQNKWFKNCTRGLAFTGSAETSVTANIKSHPAGSTIVMTNAGQFYNNYASIWDPEIIYEEYTFATTSAPSTTKIKMYFGTQFGNNYLWYDPVSDQLGYSTSSSEFAFQSGGVTFTAIRPLTLVSSELKLATSTYDFAFRDNLFALATSTVSSGTASGKALEDWWNSRWNATTTKPLAFIFSDSLTVNATSTVSGKFITDGVHRTFTCGEGITKNAALYLSATSTRVLLADSDIASSTVPFVGFARDACSADGADTTTVVQTTGIYTQSGASFTVGALYFIQGTAGTIGTTVGTVEGVVGRATSATEINMNVRHEVGEQYIGSATDGGNDVIEDVPTWARKAIVSIDCVGSIETAEADLPIYRIGKTSGTYAEAQDAASGIHLANCGASWSGNTITCSFAENATAVACTAYYYR